MNSLLLFSMFSSYVEADEIKQEICIINEDEIVLTKIYSISLHRSNQ